LIKALKYSVPTKVRDQLYTSSSIEFPCSREWTAGWENQHMKQKWKYSSTASKQRFCF